MSAPPPSPSNRIIEVLLPKGGYVLVLYEVHIDESGCDDYSKVLAIAGYMIRSDAAKSMDREWRDALVRHNLPHFHMVDCAHGNRHFKGVEPDVRTEIQKEFMALIRKYVMLSMCVVIPRQRHDELLTKGGSLEDPYILCLMNLLLQFHICLQESDKVICFLEKGHASASRASQVLASNPPTPRIAAYTFAAKSEVPLLQAADIFAWQCAKRIKDLAFTNRKARKDFNELLKTPTRIHLAFIDSGIFFMVPLVNPEQDTKQFAKRIGDIFSSKPISETHLGELVAKKMPETDNPIYFVDRGEMLDYNSLTTEQSLRMAYFSTPESAPIFNQDIGIKMSLPDPSSPWKWGT